MLGPVTPRRTYAGGVPASQIKVKVFAVLLNEAKDAHLVWRGTDETKPPDAFHRLLGGHLEFGEGTVDGVQREIAEETGASLRDPVLLGVLENRFVHLGEAGHEIVFVYTGSLDPPDVVAPDGGWLADNGEPIWVEWRRISDEDAGLPLYPLGTERLVADLVALRRPEVTGGLLSEDEVAAHPTRKGR